MAKTHQHDTKVHQLMIVFAEAISGLLTTVLMLEENKSGNFLQGETFGHLPSMNRITHCIW